MKYNISFVSAHLLWLFLVSAAFGQEYESGFSGGLRVPVECSPSDMLSLGPSTCGGGISVTDARKSYADWIRRRAISGENQEYVFPPGPVVPLLRPHRCEGALKDDQSFWAPADQFEGGRNAIAEMVSDWSSARAPPGWTYVEASDSPRGERHFALCSVREINGASGPPRSCITIALVTDSEAWLRMTDSSDPSCIEASSGSRLSGSTTVSFEISTRHEVGIFVDAIKRKLEEFGMQVESYSGDREEFVLIQSTTGLRNSRILSPGWRESFDFDIHVRRTNEVLLSVEGVAHPIVSRQASGSIFDYRGLTDAQRVQYGTYLDSMIEAAIEAACDKFFKIDAKRLSCDLEDAFQ